MTVEARIPSVVMTRSRARWYSHFRILLTMSDIAVVAMAIAVGLSFWPGPAPAGTILGIALRHVVVALIILVVWVVGLEAVRSRSIRVLAVGTAEFERVMQASMVAFGIVVTLAFLAGADISRIFLVSTFALGTAGLLVERWLWRGQLIRWRAAGRCKSNVLVTGSTRDVHALLPRLRQNHRAGFRIVGIGLTDGFVQASGPGTAFGTIEGIPTFPVEDLAWRARNPNISTVLVAGDLPGGPQALRRLGWSLEGSVRELILPHRLTDVAGPRIHLRPVSGMPFVHLALPTYSGVQYVVKRITDVVISSIGLLVTAPLFLAIALAIMLDDGGPVLFRQERVGARGKTFTMFKFRSMVVDAERRLDDLAAQNDSDGVLFKMRSDPRITRVGGVLRRYSLDELPQLVNAFIGTMSVVGPRPPLPREVAAYDGDVSRRLLSKPGITGPWQVGGRSDLSWEESVRIDLSYVENWTVWGDLLIILKTFRTVLAKEGAY